MLPLCHIDTPGPAIARYAARLDDSIRLSGIGRQIRHLAVRVSITLSEETGDDSYARMSALLTLYPR